MTDLADRLRRFSYKPVVVARVPDVHDPQRSTIVRGGKPQPPHDLTDEELTALVLAAINVVERHEADEWFMVDGKPVNDPHAPKETK